MNLWIIGAGQMAQDYASVLKALSITFTVIGRGEESANAFRAEQRIEVFTGGVSEALRQLPPPEAAIVATGIDNLAAVTIDLIKAGVIRLLVEKPGGVDVKQISKVANVAREYRARVFVAYNRRFYGSVDLARKYIDEDGGVLSGRFEFTEWSHMLEHLERGPGVKDNWVLGNSSHVIDLAFHLMGRPQRWEYWHSGALSWHQSAARFVGAGVTDKNILFSFFADWEGAGRWEIELVTKKRRLILRPMEEMRVIETGSLTERVMKLSSNLDLDFKPGLYNQVRNFISCLDERFCSIEEQVKNCRIYSDIAGYV